MPRWIRWCLDKNIRSFIVSPSTYAPSEYFYIRKPFKCLYFTAILYHNKAYHWYQSTLNLHCILLNIQIHFKAKVIIAVKIYSIFMYFVVIHRLHVSMLPKAWKCVVFNTWYYAFHCNFCFIFNAYYFVAHFYCVQTIKHWNCFNILR